MYMYGTCTSETLCDVIFIPVLSTYLGNLDFSLPAAHFLLDVVQVGLLPHVLHHFRHAEVGELLAQLPVDFLSFRSFLSEHKKIN